MATSTTSNPPASSGAEIAMIGFRKSEKARKHGLFRSEQIKSLFGTNHVPEAERITSL